jgi:hypothetical protein
MSANHPLYPKWAMAFDHRNEAQERYWQARMRGDPALAAYELDMKKAEEVYEEVCSRL